MAEEVKVYIYGVGINDSKEPVSTYVDGKQVRCKTYQKWKNMITRCYSSNYHNRYPSYIGCKVCEEWKYFSNFKSWYESQEIHSKEDLYLDKDLLCKGMSKIYSPETCVLLSNAVNNFIKEPKEKEGLPLGVTFRKGPKFRSAPYMAQCSNPFDRKVSGYLGMFSTAEKAHIVYLNQKSEYAKELIKIQTDERVKDFLRRYYVRNK